MVLSERQSESVRFVRIERHVARVGPVCDFTQICRERRSCCWPVCGMTDGAAEGGIISRDKVDFPESLRDH